MPGPNALLDHVAAISQERAVDAAGPSRRTVSFRGGRSATLEAGRRGEFWADVLETLRQTERPAYVEIDPANNAITNVLQPIEYVVARVSVRDDGVEVSLEISHARHLLLRRHPDFAALRATLEAAQKDRARVYVVENDQHEIVDVELAPGAQRPGRSPSERKGR